MKLPFTGRLSVFFLVDSRWLRLQQAISCVRIDPAIASFRHVRGGRYIRANQRSSWHVHRRWDHQLRVIQAERTLSSTVPLDKPSMFDRNVDWANFINFNRLLNKFELQNFLLPNDIESHHIDDHDSMRLLLTSVHNNSPVILFFSDKDDSKIITDDIDLAGDLIHSLVTFLNVEDLRVSERNMCSATGKKVDGTQS